MKELDGLRKALEKHDPLAEVSFSNLMPHLLRVAEAAEDLELATGAYLHGFDDDLAVGYYTAARGAFNTALDALKEAAGGGE